MKKEKSSKGELHFLLVPNILHNICQHLTDAVDARNLSKCHKKIDAIMYQTPMQLGFSLKDPLCRWTASVNKMRRVIRHLSPNWTILYIVFDFNDHCPFCHLKVTQAICRFKNIRLLDDFRFARRICNYNGKIYCSIYKQDDIFSNLSKNDVFYNFYEKLRSVSETKSLDHVPNGMPIEVPAIDYWFSKSSDKYYFCSNGVLTI